MTRGELGIKYDGTAVDRTWYSGHTLDYPVITNTETLASDVPQDHPEVDRLLLAVPGVWEMNPARVNYRGEAYEGSLTLSAPDHMDPVTIHVAVRAAERSVFKIDLHLPGAPLWSPDHPALIQVQAQLSNEDGNFDDLIERTGLRSVRVEKRKILLNDTPIRLAGFNRHEDHPDFGCAIPISIMLKDIELMRSMGANAVRGSHYPNDDRFLDLCDEFGLLVWDENHARGLRDDNFKHPKLREQCLACNEEMVTQHFNHPEHQDHQGLAERPLIISEFGAGAFFGYRDAIRRGKWSEERQCDLLEELFADFCNNDRVEGLFIWQFCDVRVDESWAMGRPRAMNNKGVVDEHRRPKLSVDVVRHWLKKWLSEEL